MSKANSMNKVWRAGLCAALLLVALVPAPANAQQPTYHTVQPGENLFRISLKYGISWPELMRANNLANSNVYVGQLLLIPVAGASAIEPTATPIPVETASAEEAPQTAPVEEAEPASEVETIAAPEVTASSYVVQRGETLFRIAVRYGTSTAALAQANGIANANFVYAGQTLTIPRGSPLAVAEQAPAPSAPTVPQTSKRIVIDISEQHMYVYEGDILLWSWVVSTGLAGQDTAPGSYHVQSKFENAYGGNWNIWMPHWLGIYWAGSLENGIHALPILSNGSRLWAGVLGTRVSYGCVVLGIVEAETLFNWAEIGTEVDIRF